MEIMGEHTSKTQRTGKEKISVEPNNGQPIQQTEGDETVPVEESNSTSQLTGQITDQSGDAIAEAQIEALETGQRAFSGPDGTYCLSSLTPVPLTIRVIATGFQAHRELIDLTEEPKTLDVRLSR
jgi:hypothetical protein